MVSPLRMPLVVQTVTAGPSLHLRDVGNLEPVQYGLGLSNCGRHKLQVLYGIVLLRRLGSRTLPGKA